MWHSGVAGTAEVYGTLLTKSALLLKPLHPWCTSSWFERMAHSTDSQTAGHCVVVGCKVNSGVRSSLVFEETREQNGSYQSALHIVRKLLFL